MIKRNALMMMAIGLVSVHTATAGTADSSNFNGFYGSFGLGVTSLNGKSESKVTGGSTQTSNNGLGSRFVGELGFGYGVTSDSFYFGAGIFANHAGAKVESSNKNSAGAQYSTTFEKSAVSWGPNIKLGYIFNPTSMIFVSVSGQYDRYALKFKADTNSSAIGQPTSAYNETVNKNHLVPVVGIGAEMHIGGNSFVQIKAEHKFGGKITKTFTANTATYGAFSNTENSVTSLNQQTAMVSYIHRF